MNAMNRLLIFNIAALLAAADVPAQDWAKARLEKSPRHLEWVKVKQGKREVNSFLAFPEVKDKATAVVVIHEIFGLTDWVRGVADQLAEAGYIAIAPDLLSGTAPNGGGTSELGGADGVRKAISSLPPDQITADLNAVVEYVSKLPACNGKVIVGGLLLGRQPVVPVCDQQQGHPGGTGLLRHRPRPGERHRPHQLPGVRLLRRQRCSRDRHGFRVGEPHEEGGQDLRTGDLRRRRPRFHARRRSARRQRSQQEGSRPSMEALEGTAQTPLKSGRLGDLFLCVGASQGSQGRHSGQQVIWGRFVVAKAEDSVPSPFLVSDTLCGDL